MSVNGTIPKLPIWAMPLPGDGKFTAIAVSNKVKVQTDWPNGLECYEEYNQTVTHALLRKWRAPGRLGGRGKWEFEFGKPPSRGAAKGGKGGAAAASLMINASRNPTFIAGEEPTALVWRIRNIPYPKEVYQIEVADHGQRIVLRTTNRKYYKRFHAAAITRAGEKIKADRITLDYSNNTLVIRYEKPMVVRKLETKVNEQKRGKIANRKGGGLGGGGQRGGGGGGGGGGDPQCKQQ